MSESPSTHPVTPPPPPAEAILSRAYQKSLVAAQERAREARRRKSQRLTGGYVLCPCSFVPGREISFVPILETDSRNGKLRNCFASCEACGMHFKLYGDGWLAGDARPPFSLDQEGALTLSRLLVSLKAGWEKLWPTPTSSKALPPPPP